MTKEDYQFLENTLRGLALFIAERKEQEQWFIDEKKKADFRRLFFIVGSEEPAPAPKPTAAPMRNVKPEALQSNINQKEKGISNLTEKEIEEMLINIPGISMTNKPRKDGRFQGYAMVNGKRVYVYGRTRSDVAEKLKLLVKGAYGKQRAHKTLNGVPATFSAFTMYYFENFRKKKVTELTYKIDVRRFNKNLAPYFKETPLKKITPLQCQALLDSITEQGKGKTADEIHSLLSIIFKMAIKHGILQRSPLDVVYHEKHSTVSGKALTMEEEQRLKTALQGTKFLDFCMLALYTGLRPNEYKTARIEGDFIVAVNSKRKHKRIEYKKIPIIKALKPFLVNGMPKIPRAETFRKAYKGILPNHIIYDMRTTFYTRCKEFGVSEHALSEYMGHSLGPIGNAYTDLSDEFLKNESKKLDFWQ